MMDQKTIDAEIEKFESYFKALGWGDFRFRKHIYNESWTGTENTMPKYVDDWAQSLWVGWKCKVESEAMCKNWFKTTKPLAEGWYWWRIDENDTEPRMYYSNGVSNVTLSVSDLDYCAEEDTDWSGEWYGPIERPI